MTKPYVLPTSFHENLIIAEPVTAAGEKLEFYTDTGGGAEWIYADDATRIGLGHFEMRDGDEWSTANMPEFRPDAWIPNPRDSDSAIAIHHGPRLQRQADAATPIGDSGLLGQGWFGGRIWEFDYQAEQLILHPSTPLTWPGTVVPLGFRQTDGGRLSFPRIRISVDGDDLDVLLDTGARAELTASAVTALRASSSLRATSFMSTSIIDQWRGRHQDWPVIEGGDTFGAAMIRVPSVEIAGLTTGPVWFTQRPDRNFTKYMSQWMDKPVIGAIGGNALSSFRMLIDYPAAKATLRPTR